MDDIIDSDIVVEKPGVGVVIMILPVEEVAAAALRIEVPEENAEADLGEVAGKVN